MAADFFLGESLVGDGNEIAHIDLIIGSKSGPAGTAFTNALANNKDGFTTLLAVVTPNLAAKDDQKIYDFNYQATKEAIARALANKPSVDEVIAGARTAKHPFASNAERKHGVGV
jgi:5,6,7,8-tetrahydromethanopterin hydro-lyase